MGSAKSWLAVGILLIGGCISVQAAAQENAKHIGKFIAVDQSVGLIKNVFLLVNDQVSGGCWSNAKQVREQVKNSLEQSGLRVYDEPLLIMSPLSSNFVITAQGSRGAQGVCFGTIRVESYRSVVSKFEGVNIQHQAYNFFQDSVEYSRNNLNNVFLKAIETYTDIFTKEVKASRKNPVVAEILMQWSGKETNPLPVKALADIFRKSAGAAGDAGSPAAR